MLREIGWRCDWLKSVPFQSLLRHILAEKLLQLSGEGAEQQKSQEVCSHCPGRVQLSIPCQLSVHFKQNILPAFPSTINSNYTFRI